MTPQINLNAFVVIKQTSVNDLKSGDIIAFKSPSMGGEVVIHRIYEISGGSIITKGDANETADRYPVKHSELLGKCVVINNSLSGYIGKIRTLPGFILLLLLPIVGLIVLVNAIYNIIAYNRRKKKKIEDSVIIE
jgi:signal peptidase